MYLVADSVLGTEVALKCVDPTSDPAFRDSLAREFGVLSTLSIAGVAPVFDLGVMPPGGDLPAGPFFTRAYVPGEPLDLFTQRVSIPARAELFGQIMEIVSTLHRHGVVHGDLKPANIIVDSGGAPHLIDFGLAGRTWEGASLGASGTPLYMAPELFEGARASVATDVYAAGATLWAVVVGRAPFADLGPGALRAKLQGQLPQMPADASGLSRALLEVAVAAMRPKRERVPSADELRAMVERALGPSTRSSTSVLPAFVIPRPCGRESLLARLDAGRGPEDTGILLVCGGRGMGKTTLLREFKWRQQLAGRTVVEVRCRGAAHSPLQQLIQQTAALRSELRTEDPTDALLALLAASESHESGVLLIDDLDAAPPAFLHALEAALHELGKAPASIVVSAEDARSAAVSAIPAWQVVTLEPLPVEITFPMIKEALGAVDEAIALGLAARAGGNPGLLVEALAFAAARPALTLEELEHATPGEIGETLARSRFEQLSEAGQRCFGLLTACRGTVGDELLAGLLGDAWRRACEELRQSRLAEHTRLGWSLTDAAVCEWLRVRRPAWIQECAREALKLPDLRAMTSAAVIAELLIAVGGGHELASVARAAMVELLGRGQGVAAGRIGEAALAAASGPDRVALRLELATLYESLGDATRCLEQVDALLSDGHADEGTLGRARVLGGRTCVASGNLRRAVELLSDVPTGAAPSIHAQAARELARVHLRRGESDLARAAVARGLATCLADDVSRPELLALDATLVDMAGDRGAAEKRFADALTAAEQLGSDRDMALVLGYLAMSHERAGELARAADAYQRALNAARALGDLGLTANYASNLGNVSLREGQTDLAATHFAMAGQYARRCGRTATALLAQNNLAHVHLYLGALERARALAEASLADAERLGIELARAHALHILGDVAARLGDHEQSLARYDGAAGTYEKLGRYRDLAEVSLDAAQSLLDRAGFSDASAASAKLAHARALIDRHRIEDLRLRLKYLLARALSANGDVEGGLRELEKLGQTAGLDRELAWQVCAAQAHSHRLLGAGVLARKKALEAAELLEREVARVPRDARDAFRAEPRRRAVLEAAASSQPAQTSSTHQRSWTSDSRFERLLEIIKRLARERDLDRLLERITDAAVDLSGAERGFVLLVDAQGQLAPHTVRSGQGGAVDPHVAFSRSIAEAVLIDGEPLITTNARDDRRVNEFMSVHKLMLKSVACIPISGPQGVVGVLYLEHRLRAGRFQEGDLDLMMAFADQAAIALENARLWSDNEQRQRELETKNRELESARVDIERLLDTRTGELEQAQRALIQARAELAREAHKYGIIGQSPAMRRVFSLIERVRESNVSVVVEGESGTGKELVARAIHTTGPRASQPFVAVNCGALSEQLLESELFGHVRGAFTGADRDKKGLFALADGGTLFLDEFADVPMRMQLDLLRVLQEGRVRPVGSDQDVRVDVRVIVAVNRPLKDLVAERKLREDLYYRLSVVEMRLPPLRERLEDVPLLCEHFLSRVAQRDGLRPKKLSRAALERILATGLPGNVRQLEHILLGASVMADGTTIEPSDLLLEGHPQEPPVPERTVAPEVEVSGDDVAAPQGEGEPPGDLRSFKQRERQRIVEALERHAWNRAKAATDLGMPRRTFYRRLAEFGIL